MVLKYIPRLKLYRNEDLNLFVVSSPLRRLPSCLSLQFLERSLASYTTLLYMARNASFKQLRGPSAPRPVELVSPHALPMTTQNAAW